MNQAINNTLRIPELLRDLGALGSILAALIEAPPTEPPTAERMVRGLFERAYIEEARKREAAEKRAIGAEEDHTALVEYLQSVLSLGEYGAEFEIDGAITKLIAWRDELLGTVGELNGDLDAITAERDELKRKLDQEIQWCNSYREQGGRYGDKLRDLAAVLCPDYDGKPEDAPEDAPLLEDAEALRAERDAARRVIEDHPHGHAFGLVSSMSAEIADLTVRNTALADGAERIARERDRLKAQLDKLKANAPDALTSAMDRSPLAALFRIADIVGLSVDPRKHLSPQELSQRLGSRVAGIVGERDTACRRLERVAHRLGLSHDATAQELVEAIDAQSSGARLEEVKRTVVGGAAPSDTIALINSMIAWATADAAARPCKMADLENIANALSVEWGFGEPRVSDILAAIEALQSRLADAEQAIADIEAAARNDRGPIERLLRAADALGVSVDITKAISVRLLVAAIRNAAARAGVELGLSPAAKIEAGVNHG